MVRNSLLQLLPQLVARAPAKVHAKLLVAFLAIVILLIAVGAVGLQVLSHSNRRATELVDLQRKIAAYRQLQHDTTAQLYSVASALLVHDERTLEATLRQLNQFGYNLDRLQFVAKDEVELLGQVRKDYDQFIQVVSQAVELIRAGKITEGNQLQLTQANPLAERLERLMNQLVNRAEADMVASVEASDAAYTRSRWIVIGFAVGSIALALLLGYAISWSVVGPVQQMDTRLQQIASGDFSQRVEVPNRDELGTLAANLNRMSDELGRLYQQLEARSRELARSVIELKALGDVGQAVSSTLDLQTVLTTVVARAVELSATEGGVIYEYDEALREFHVRATHRIEEELVEALQLTPIRLGEGVVGQAATTRAPVQVTDILDERELGATRLRPMLGRLGYRSLLAVPLLREERIMGGLTIYRRATGSFSTEVVNLLQTFASQSVVAIQNAQLFREIEEKSRQLEVANRHKSDFLANVSHDLRTPLNSIIGFTRIVLRRTGDQIPDLQKENLQKVLISSEHLLKLINGLLDLAKIEAGKMEAVAETFRVEDVINMTTTSVEPLLKDGRVRIVREVPPDLPTVKTDRDKLKQILLNLLSNAAKFTEQGEIRVSASRENGTLKLAVSDTGIGMKKEALDHIFEEFQQAEKTTASKYGGTGLGLAIVKKFTNLMGGNIAVESEVGKGSKFTITIPINLKT
ncbi:MAG TPA: ATP-binding protein [Candidatus Binatia bacterium]|nr:ATP-binding protein [Candidatus Binatia bacterium]